MAQLYSTGPALIFVGLTPPSVSSPGSQAQRFNIVAANVNFLGTAEYAPEIHARPGWEPVFNDFGGSRIPFDMMYEGIEAFTFADLNRWNENILQQCQARPRTVLVNPANPQEGLNFSGDVGSLMLTEGLSYTVFVVFPFALKPAYASMPAGYRFPFSWLEGPDEHKNLGTKPKKIHIIFHHLRGFNPTNGQFLLFDHNIPPGILGLIN